MIPPDPARTAVTSVLVIEENTPLGALLQTLLRRGGFDVEWVRGASEATERIGTRAFDAVVLDLMSPGANGYHLLDILERRDMARRTVVTTGVSEAHAAEVRPRVFAVVRKPFENEEMVRTVSRCAACAKPPGGGGGAPGAGMPKPGAKRSGDPENGPSRSGAAPAAARRMTMLEGR